ncbi:MAG TPA: hypothetical protein VMU61_04040 [Candidatus Aquilonibacter sp.]|nr:hypothetical protein [Candidatus Aquilonibacter sp.]
MRRLWAIATFGFFLAALPALAQRGGGRGFSGGHGGGFAARGSYGGHFGGARAFGGVRSGGFGHSSFSRPFSSRGFGQGFQRFRGPFISNYNNYGYGRRPWGWGWPWWGDYDPWWWDSDSYSSYDPDYEQQLQIAQEMNQQSLEEQQMRWQENRELYANRTPEPQPQREETHAESILPPTVLVFQDQHKQEIQNYAIVGRTLWAFSPQRTQKIPLSDLDISATVKANDDRGVEFSVPGSGEGQ